jgi:hypothetical protein
LNLNLLNQVLDTVEVIDRDTAEVIDRDQVIDLEGIHSGDFIDLCGLLEDHITQSIIK